VSAETCSYEFWLGPRELKYSSSGVERSVKPNATIRRARSFFGVAKVAATGSALRASGKYTIRCNVRVPLTTECRRWVHRAQGAYLGASLPCGDGTTEGTIVDMVVIDKCNSWAGGYAFCWGGSHSSRTRRRIAGELRAAELVLRAHFTRFLASNIATVTVGIIDGAADGSRSDDLTISLHEIADHFNICFLPTADATPPRVSG
jgi:hypothetical protein